MSFLIDYLHDYLKESKDNIIIFEGLNGSGKTTLCKELMFKYSYFKHIGAYFYDGKSYDSKIITNYRLIDRFRPIQDYIVSVEHLFYDDNKIPSKKFNDFALKNLNQYCSDYLDSSIRNPMFVFLIHGRYLDKSLKERNRKKFDENFYSNNIVKNSYKLIIKELSKKYRVLVIDKKSMKIYYGDLNENQNN